MDDQRRKNNRFLLGLALIGIALEIVAIALLAAGRLEVPIAMPIVIGGMLIAFAPIFAVARRAKR